MHDQLKAITSDKKSDETRKESTLDEFDNQYVEMLRNEIEHHTSSAPSNYLEWRQFCNLGEPERPIVPGQDEWAAMDRDAQKQSRRARWRYHAQFGPVRTPNIDRIIREIIEKARENLVGAIGARNGFVISADPTLGKSTILFMLGLEYEKQMQDRYKPILGEFAQTYVPVSFNVMGSQYTIRNMNEAMADFYGTPYGSRDSGASIGRKLIREAKSCMTSLVIIDDIHHVRPGYKNQQPLNDHIKMLTTVIPATFVYAGVNVHRSGFFRQGHGEQVTARFKKFTINPFSPEDTRSWTDYLVLLQNLERKICLLNHQEGDLVGLAQPIFEMTQGKIGAIVRLVRETANQAIRSGRERVTARGLANVIMDTESEDQYARRQASLRARNEAKKITRQHQKKSSNGPGRRLPDRANKGD